MTEKLTTTDANNSRRQQNARKIDKLKEIYKGGKDEGALNCFDTAAPDSLINNLLSKAPADFLESKSLEELAAITEESSKFLVSWKANKSKLLVKAVQHKDHTSFFCIISDRPFIVNSISACLEESGLKVAAILHPILIEDGIRISLTYFETEKVSNEKVAILIKQLENSLSDLLIATDDFTAMLIRVETIAKTLENPNNHSSFPQSERKELSEFLRWLADGGFIFLGYAEWRASGNNGFEKKPSSSLGIFKSQLSYKTKLIEEAIEDCQKAVESNNLLYFTKLDSESLIHRRIKLNNITIPEFSTDGKIVAMHSITGMLTSKALAEESSSIPIIRRKMQKILEIEDVLHNSHDYKYIVDIFDKMPKEEALRQDLEVLREIVHTVIGQQNKNETRVSIKFDNSKRGISILVVMPRERFNSYVRKEIQHYAESYFGVQPDSSEYHLDLSNKPLARFYFYLPTTKKELTTVNVAKFEKDINDLSRTWEESLQESIRTCGAFQDPKSIWVKYGRAFTEEYQALQDVSESLGDIINIESLSTEVPIKVSIFDDEDVKDGYSLVVYNNKSEMSISKTFPILENAGLEVISEKSSIIAPYNSIAIFIQKFLVKPKKNLLLKDVAHREMICSGIAKIFVGEAENDRLNSLMLNADLDVSKIALLRTFCNLLWQVSDYATKGSIFEAFSEEPNAARTFWQMFESKFNPAREMPIADRWTDFSKGLAAFIDLLRDVKDINKDRILRGLANILENTVRTNYFQFSQTIAIKIMSENVEIMPSPKPKFEIFVTSPNIEGVHLRSAMIARGGIRWSDRNDDFRSEVLGLVKTQKIKNAVIVPNGAKGGFVLRQLPKEAEQIPKAVLEGYKEYIRSLLSITDNKIGATVVHPDKVICFDGEDPYFVVAADKGTATFSDTANEIAVKEFNFWLGDAFASGGSRGYDHKKYGITAKGAWQCVKRHFHDIGIDYSNVNFTAVGIGDMSGDVFGNGMILSSKIKLLGAFNHAQIFIDPDPDPQLSFQERERLFKLPRSKWSDYDRTIISKGGGVFERFDKEIKITPEIRAALSIGETVPETISGEELIRHILMAKVDLLWNGGIGTYVKSDSETHADVNDGTNDRVRINASELRTKVVGEGGNLGFTQQARIDFALKGGRINTDAIDNSAGVDLSDHEVNLKILFADLIKDGKTTLEQRDVNLKSMAADVVESVLQHNRNHSILLSIGTARSNKSIEYYKSLIQILNKMGYINRDLESLPDDEKINDRMLKKQGLSSPELAVCVAGVKMWVKDVLINSPLCNDPRLEDYIVEYFPPALQKQYRNEIVGHALSRAITASQVANTLIDAVGITFVHRMCVTHSTTPTVVLKCLLAAQIIINARQIRASLDKYDNFEHNKFFSKLRQGIGKTLRDATSWIISCHGKNFSLDEIVKLYESSYGTLLKHADELFIGEMRENYFETLKSYQSVKLDDFAAKSLALAPNIVQILEMLWAARRANENVQTVAYMFSHIYHDLGLDPIIQATEAMENLNKWEHQLILSSFQEIRRAISVITCNLAKKEVKDKGEISKEIHNSSSYEELKSLIDEISSTSVNAAALSIVARQLMNFQI